MKIDFTSLLVSAIVLLAASQAAEGLQTPVALFIRGVATGLAIVCAVTGLVLYGKATAKG